MSVVAMSDSKVLAGADAVPRDLFVNAMARAVTGVSVVATDGAAGRFALTVSAVTSVSADPPLLLACISRRNPLREAVLINRRFAVSLLAAAQPNIADVCAGRGPGRPFDVSDIPWITGEHGLPLVAEASAHFECVLETAHEAGSHTILLGRVLAASAADTAPLLYSLRQYGRPEPLAA